MISIISSSRLILIILVLSVLIIPIGKSAALPTDTPIAAVKPLAAKINDKPGVDKFGVTEIYPTKPNGREWYVNMNSPLNDNNFFLSGGNQANMTFRYE
jgi:hypothetical protein